MLCTLIKVFSHSLSLTLYLILIPPHSLPSPTLNILYSLSVYTKDTYLLLLFVLCSTMRLNYASNRIDIAEGCPCSSINMARIQQIYCVYRVSSNIIIVAVQCSVFSAALWMKNHINKTQRMWHIVNAHRIELYSNNTKEEHCFRFIEINRYDNQVHGYNNLFTQALVFSRCGYM